LGGCQSRPLRKVRSHCKLGCCVYNSSFPIRRLADNSSFPIHRLAEGSQTGTYSAWLPSATVGGATGRRCHGATSAKSCRPVIRVRVEVASALRRDRRNGHHRHHAALRNRHVRVASRAVGYAAARWRCQFRIAAGALRASKCARPVQCKSAGRRTEAVPPTPRGAGKRSAGG